MTVTTRSGRALTIPRHHPVFTPLGDYRDGDRVDPETVALEPDRVTTLEPGDKIIVDDVVEVVARVAGG